MPATAFARSKDSNAAKYLLVLLLLMATVTMLLSLGAVDAQLNYADSWTSGTILDNMVGGWSGGASRGGSSSGCSCG